MQARAGLGSVHIGEGDAREPSWRNLGRKYRELLSTQNLVITSMASSDRGAGCVGARGRGWAPGIQGGVLDMAMAQGCRSRVFGSRPMPFMAWGWEREG
jgi:hypothetical protein